MTVKCLLSFLYCNLYLISYAFIHVSHIFYLSYFVFLYTNKTIHFGRIILLMVYIDYSVIN